MGSLDARWGVDLSIRAMPLLRRKIPDIRLLIAGRGPAEQELRQLAQSLGFMIASILRDLCLIRTSRLCWLRQILE